MAHIRFEVTDTGVGMTAEELQIIFEPFQQVGDDKYKAQGTGLGLAISRNLIRLMGGELQVESPPSSPPARGGTGGPGSTFWFELTVPVVTPAAAAAPPETRPIIGVAGPAPRILVVDDDPTNRRVIVDALAPLGFEIQEAENGRDAWQRCLAFHPQAVITDLRMPEMDGLTLIRQLRQTPAFDDLVIIASSASAYEDDRQRSLTAGSQAFLPKPFELGLLLKHLQEFLHLTWRYQDAGENAASPAASPAWRLPPAAALQTLHGFASMGDILHLRQALADLAEDGRFTPFVNQIQELAGQFKVGAIWELLEGYLAQGNEDDPAVILTPAALRSSLQEAAETLDVEQTLTVLAEIRPQNAPLADALAELVQHYRFDTLQSLFE